MSLLTHVTELLCGVVRARFAVAYEYAFCANTAELLTTTIGAGERHRIVVAVARYGNDAVANNSPIKLLSPCVDSNDLGRRVCDDIRLIHKVAVVPIPTVPECNECGD